MHHPGNVEPRTTRGANFSIWVFFAIAFIFAVVIWLILLLLERLLFLGLLLLLLQFWSRFSPSSILGSIQQALTAL
jgi:hypothetical protein